jgi:glucose-1-phosphate cytidylyltransferase
MQVVILCGGLGTRLREETEFRPKPMVNIGPRPVLWHIMKRYAAYGHTEFVLCLGYKGEIIKEYFYNYEIMNNDFTMELGKRDSYLLHQCHDEAGWKVTMADTGEKALKGARIKKIERHIVGDEFLMTYGDGVADIDLDALLAFHRGHKKLITLTGVNPASRFGEMKLSGDRVVSFREKPDKANTYISGGFFVVNRALFDRLTTDDSCDFEVGPLEQIAREGQLMIYKHPGSWACMDTLRDADFLNGLWNSGKAFWKKW